MKVTLEKSVKELTLGAKPAVLCVLHKFVRPLLCPNTWAASYFSIIKVEVYLFFRYSFILSSLFIVHTPQDLCDTCWVTYVIPNSKFSVCLCFGKVKISPMIQNTLVYHKGDNFGLFCSQCPPHRLFNKSLLNDLTQYYINLFSAAIIDFKL